MAVAVLPGPRRFRPYCNTRAGPKGRSARGCDPERKIRMAAAKRVWLRWALIGVVVAVLGVTLWLAESQGWLSSAYVRGWGLISGEEMEEPAEEGMESMPGMVMGDGEKTMNGGPAVPGYAPVVIEPGLQQRIGVTIGTVEQEPLLMSVETVGIVQPNETQTARVHLRTEGWVEELFVNFTGQRVEKGDPLLSIYSPEFLRAQEEYLVASQSDALQTLGRGPQSLAQTTLQKLRLWGVPEDELRQLERTGQPQVNLTLRSPLSGTVLMKNVLEGEYVTPQRELYMISDLSTVWVQAKVYQYELPHIELGTAATITAPGLDQAFSGKVVFVQPVVEEATRTVQVRIELPDPEGLLKPDMFVHVEIEHPMGEGLLVPASAVIRTGERQIAFRVESGNRFVPVEVEIGTMKFDEERYHVLEGLKAGDRVVTSANFLIDSESRLRHSGGGMMPGMPGMEMDMPGVNAEGEDTEGMEEMDHSGMKH